MKRTTLTLTLLVTLTVLSATAYAAPAETSDPEKVFIQFDETIDYDYLKAIGATITADLPAISAVIATLSSSDTYSTFQTANDELTITPYPEDDLFYQTAETTNWGYKPVLADKAYSLGYRGDTIKVGVIDSGINSQHPDLRVAGGISFVTGSHLRDSTGHGTHVAGILAAQANSIGVRGVAPNVELYSIRIFGDGPSSPGENLALAIQWAIDNDMDILNMSLTGPDFPAVRDLAEKAYSEGILLVAASGNSYPSDRYDVQFPAKYSSVIAVGALGQSNTIYKSSERGPSQEFVAPGENIYSTAMLTGTSTQEDYALKTGTSMASPFVAGIAAQYMQAYPGFSNDQIRKLMQRNAKDYGTEGRDSIYGYGLIQSVNYLPGLYPDTKLNVWYSDAIKKATEEGIISGFPDGTFRPNDPLTRAQAVSMLGRALGWPASTTAHFQDVSPESFAFSPISYAYEQQIVSGVSSTRFAPQSSIKRGDLALIVYNALKLPVTTASTFSDVPGDKYYSVAIQSMIENGIMVGYPKDQTFRPEQPVTRAEFTMMIYQALYALQPQ